MGGFELQRKLGEGSFAEVTSGSSDVDAVLRGGGSASVSSARVRVGLFFGELKGLGVSGTRILVKAYSADGQPPWAEEPGPDVRAKLEALFESDSSSEMSDEEPASASAAAAAAALEASALGGQQSAARLAEALALNEYAAHARVQRTAGPAGGSDDIEKRGVTRLLGRVIEREGEGESGGSTVIMHAFPWRGEVTRMALPTRLPPTLGSWLVQCAQGVTAGQSKWKGVPLRAAEQRGRFARAALRGALRGLDELHRAGLVHQGLGPSAVLVSSEDCFATGDKARGTLQELGFARDASSLYPAYYVAADGLSLSDYGEAVESGNAAPDDPLDLGLTERAMRRTLRPGDPFERARFARADDMREFGLLLLCALVLPNAPPGALEPLQLRSLTDGAFAASDADGMKTDGVDVAGLRAYLAADDSLRVGGERDGRVGGVELLDAGGQSSGGGDADADAGVPRGSGWELLGRLLSAEWAERPSAEEALAHPFWDAVMSPKPVKTPS